MADSPCASPLTPAAPAFDAASVPVPTDVGEAMAFRLRATVEKHYDFVWRTLRHLGFAGATAEDGAQQVMCVLARHFAKIEPGAERSFLYATAVRVAATLRRAAKRHPEWAGAPVDAVESPTPDAEELLDERRKHEFLQGVLDAMPFDLRVVFVLHEIEELSGPEVAATIGVPLGTATSRLRRAREQFQACVRRLQAGQGPRE
jgi:RNA polymerase sigma-70 factor (ECF subfamily)